MTSKSFKLILLFIISTLSMANANPFLQEFDLKFSAVPFDKIELDHYAEALELGLKEQEEDIKKMILLGKDEGILEEKEKDYILNVFNFNDIEVSKVMTQKNDVVMLNIEDDLKTNIFKMKKSKYLYFLKPFWLDHFVSSCCNQNYKYLQL